MYSTKDRTTFLIVALTIFATLFAQEFLVAGSFHKVVNELQWMAKSPQAQQAEIQSVHRKHR